MDKTYIHKAILFFPVAGRIGSLAGASISSYARSVEGLGKSFIDFCGWKELFIGLLFHMLIFFGCMGVDGVLLSFIPVVTAFLLVKFLGDTK